MTKAKPLPPLETLNALYTYDPDQGLFSKKTGLGIKTMSNRGYLFVRIAGTNYQAHRVAWYMHTGIDPVEFQIDHVDRDRTNNRFNNLRLATNQLNAKNTGAKGWVKVGDRYRAVIVHDRKQQHLGYFKTPEEARDAYLSARAEYITNSSCN